MTQAKRNVVLLALCQALAMSGSIILFATAALIGYELAADKALATLPLALQQLATMLATIPAAMLLNRFGRRVGFLIGATVGLAGAGLAVLAVFLQSFELFCLATVLFGSFSGFVGYYRFAAADVASAAFRSQAVSFVVAGGIIAAIAGPNLANWAKDGFTSTPFAGSLLVIVGLQIVSLGLLAGLRIPPPAQRKRQAEGRSLSIILQQPVFIVAVLGSMVGYGVMAMIMTATPLAMTAGQFSFASAAIVIQWHVLGMFVPSLFTGLLISRFGVLNIILLGIGLNILCTAINLLGTSFSHFAIALLLLGVGWNFMFIGSTTLLTEVYTPNDQAKTQAFHDFLMFAFVALATFLSGRILYSFSWAAVNYTGLMMVGISLVATLWLRQSQDRKLRIKG